MGAMTARGKVDEIAEAERSVVAAENELARLEREKGPGARQCIETRMALHVARVKLAAAREVG